MTQALYAHMNNKLKKRNTRISQKNKTKTKTKKSMNVRVAASSTLFPCES
jgi:hypothetical protein